MSAMIIGSWTAFETLAGDLWEDCLNARPRLGIVALGAEPDSKDDEAKLEQKKRIKYNLPVWLLREFGYDLTRRMGTLLRGKWDFASRNSAADAYSKVFKDQMLDQLFADDNLKWLAATRNAIVHNGSIADSEFTTLVKS